MYVVGKVLKPQGLKGELKTEIVTSFPEHFKKLTKLYFKQNDEFIAYRKVQARINGRFVFLKLEGIDRIEQAEQFRKKEVFIDEDQLTTLPEDEYFVHDLIGLQVFDEKDRLLGEIVDVELAASNDCYVLQDAGGKQYLIPAIRDIVKQIDISDKRMVIHVMAGLLD